MYTMLDRSVVITRSSMLDKVCSVHDVGQHCSVHDVGQHCSVHCILDITVMYMMLDRSVVITRSSCWTGL